MKKDYFDDLWLDVPMPEDYTCGCGLFVHPIRRNYNAIHCKDCMYYDDDKNLSKLLEKIALANKAQVGRYNEIKFK